MYSIADVPERAHGAASTNGREHHRRPRGVREKFKPREESDDGYDEQRITRKSERRDLWYFDLADGARVRNVRRGTNAPLPFPTFPALLLSWPVDEA